MIVADSAYPPEKFVCKPLVRPQAANEVNYQQCQIKARNVAERVNGQLKKEFPILKYGMRFKKRAAAQDVVVTCCILHNMRKLTKVRNYDYTEIELLRQTAIADSWEIVEMEDGEERMQNFLVHHHFR